MAKRTKPAAEAAPEVTAPPAATTAPPQGVVEVTGQANDPAAQLGNAVGGEALVDVAGAIRSLTPGTESGANVPPAAEPDPGRRAPKSGAERAREFRQRKRDQQGGATASPGRARGGRRSMAEVEAENAAMRERLRLLESPQDAEQQRRHLRQGLIGTFAGVSFVASRTAPELGLMPEETEYLADAWMPIAEMHGAALAHYVPYLAACGALVVVYAPKFDAYAKRVEAEKKRIADLPEGEATVDTWRKGDAEPTPGEVS